jgi:hypothetical protein
LGRQKDERPEKAVYREQVKLNAGLREFGSRLALKLKHGGFALMLDKCGDKRIMEIREADVNE